MGGTLAAAPAAQPHRLQGREDWEGAPLRLRRVAASPTCHHRPEAAQTPRQTAAATPGPRDGTPGEAFRGNRCRGARLRRETRLQLQAMRQLLHALFA